MATTVYASLFRRSLRFVALLMAPLSLGLPPHIPAHAGEVGPGEGMRHDVQSQAAAATLPLTLQQSVLLALHNNMDIRVERLTPLIRAEEVRREAGAFFSPRLSLEANADRSQRPAGSVLAGADVLESQNVDVNTGVALRSITGGVVSVDFRNKRLETNSVFQIFDPQYTAELALTLTHPLLKNFGIDLNSTRIKVAQNNLELSKQQLAAAVTTLVADVQQAYWDLVLATHDLAARRRALEVARHLERRTAELVAKGRLPALATLQAEATVLERRLDLQAAEDAFENAEQRLKALLNLEQTPLPADLVLLPTDVPRSEPHMISVEEGVKQALANRPEVSQAKLDRENKRLGVAFAKNQRLPELNLVGSVGLSGLSGTLAANPFSTITIGGVPLDTFLATDQTLRSFEGGYEDALGKMLSSDFISYRVGVTVQIPLGNQVARSELAKARLELEKAKAMAQSVEQKIALEVERLARALKSAWRAIEGVQALRTLAQRKLDMAQEGLELGVSSVTDVIEAQKNFTLAQRDELKTIIEYNKMLTLWEKATGMTLARFNITL
jgi:outer membrane protein TolC